VIGRTLGVEDAYAIGRSFATAMRRSGGTRVALGWDGRLSSESLRDELIRGLTASGIDVVRIGLGPTPMLYFAEAVLEVDGGIQITGSHNPADYNGFKMVLHHKPYFGADIQALGAMAAAGDWDEGAGIVSDADIEDRYVDRMVEDHRGGAFRIGWDNGNGAGGRILEKLVARLPGEHHCLYTEIDGRFPHHHPDPTVEANLADLKQLVADRGLDFGIAFDGDADRIGAIDGRGRVVWGDQLLAILAEPVLRDCPGATIVGDIKASQTLFDRIAELGGKPVMWKSGHSLMKVKMAETDSPLAGEMSGHIFFGHRWYGVDDALYAAVPADRGGDATRRLADRTQGCDAGAGQHPRAALPGRRGAQVRGRRRGAGAARRSWRRDRPYRRRAGQHVRWVVAAARVEHPGCAGRPRRIGRPGRARPADGADRRTARLIRDRSQSPGRGLKLLRPQYHFGRKPYLAKIALPSRDSRYLRNGSASGLVEAARVATG
jgi:phosphomannomutase